VSPLFRQCGIINSHNPIGLHGQFAGIALLPTPEGCAAQKAVEPVTFSNLIHGFEEQQSSVVMAAGRFFFCNIQKCDIGPFVSIKQKETASFLIQDD
jgi:hypothetical protein